MDHEFMQLLAEEIAHRDKELAEYINGMDDGSATRFMREDAPHQIMVAAALASVVLTRATQHELHDLVKAIRSQV